MRTAVASKLVKFGDNMYSVIDTENGRGLIKLKTCTKKFTTNGKLVKFSSSGMVLLPVGSMISVCKTLPWVFHHIRMAKSKQSLHYNAIIEKYDLGEYIDADEEEMLLASLEVIENI